jgi:hypothetical protein
MAWEGDHALSGDIAALEKLIADGGLTVTGVAAD